MYTKFLRYPFNKLVVGGKTLFRYLLIKLIKIKFLIFGEPLLGSSKFIRIPPTKTTCIYSHIGVYIDISGLKPYWGVSVL